MKNKIIYCFRVLFFSCALVLISCGKDDDTNVMNNDQCMTALTDLVPDFNDFGGEPCLMGYSTAVRNIFGGFSESREIVYELFDQFDQQNTDLIFSFGEYEKCEMARRDFEGTAQAYRDDFGYEITYNPEGVNSDIFESYVTGDPEIGVQIMVVRKENLMIAVDFEDDECITELSQLIRVVNGLASTVF